MKIIINARSYDFNSYKENIYIIFDNKINEIGPMSKFFTLDESLFEDIIDAGDSIVLPGLINGHTHIYSTLSRGMNVPFNPKSFKQILEQLWWKLDGVLEKSDCYISGLVYGLDCIKNGVTTLIDHHASGEHIMGTLNELKTAICDDLGLRGIFCFETSDRFDVDLCIKENLLFSKERTEKYCGLFGMHASMTLSKNTLSKISNIKGVLPIHIHVAESIEDEADSIGSYDKTVVERLQEHRLLSENSILSHCVHINDLEAQLIKESKAYVAINPTSNMNNAVGLPDFNLLRKYNIPCIIGNDGLGANITREYLNLTYAMKNKYKDPLAFGLNDLLTLINNTYTYTSKLLNIKIGKIEEGYAADLIIVPYSPPTIMNNENIFGHVFFGLFDNFTPKYVYSGGKPLMVNYEVFLPFREVYEKSIQASEKIWNKLT